MLKVGFDTQPLVDGSQYRGIGTYVRAVLDGLASHPEIRVSALAVAGTPLPEQVQRVHVRRLAPARFAWWEHDLRLPGEIQRLDADVFHSPGQYAPRRSSLPWVQTLFDVIPLTFTDPSLRADRARWRRQGSRFRRASAVVAISRASADDGIRVLGLDPDKVHVVPCGHSPSFRPPDSRPRPDPPYLLCVSAWGPHKGFAEAAALMSILADAGYPHRLVIAGARDAWSLDRVRTAVAASGQHDRVDVVGYVDNLVGLYQGASVFISTSRAEGFGLPAVEAMACGTPVVAFANTSQPEVIGDGGVLVADGDVAAMAAAVKPLLDDDRVWAESSERALRRAQAFDWRRSVNAHVEILRSVADR